MNNWHSHWVVTTEEVVDVFFSFFTRKISIAVNLNKIIRINWIEAVGKSPLLQRFLVASVLVICYHRNKTKYVEYTVRAILWESNRKFEGMSAKSRATMFEFARIYICFGRSFVDWVKCSAFDLSETVSTTFWVEFQKPQANIAIAFSLWPNSAPFRCSCSATALLLCVDVGFCVCVRVCVRVHNGTMCLSHFRTRNELLI